VVKAPGCDRGHVRILLAGDTNIQLLPSNGGSILLRDVRAFVFCLGGQRSSTNNINSREPRGIANKFNSFPETTGPSHGRLQDGVVQSKKMSIFEEIQANSNSSQVNRRSGERPTPWSAEGSQQNRLDGYQELSGTLTTILRPRCRVHHYVQNGLVRTTLQLRLNLVFGFWVLDFGCATPGPSWGYSKVNFQRFFEKPGHSSPKVDKIALTAPRTRLE
jgi:hypothetical protein